MPRGGARIGAGRPRKTPVTAQVATNPLVEGSVVSTAASGRRPEQKADVEKMLALPDVETPLVYMLRLLNDPTIDALRRDRLAVALAPYLHAKLGETGKKPAKDEAAKKATEAGKRFAATPGPRLAVSNR